MQNPRLTAVNALIKVNSDNAFSNITLNSVLDEKIDARDKALISALFYGVLDRRITIDWYLSFFLKQPVKKLRPVTREALRTGVYQIIYMDKIPNSAAVNEAVKTVKFSKERANAGLVNAVLRNLIRDIPKLPTDNSVKSLSICYSCPEAIVASLINDYGENNTVEYLKSTLQAPKVYLRVNTLKTDQNSLAEILNSEGIKAEKTELENCLTVLGGINVNLLSYKNGLYHFQDIASQKCALLLNAKDGERILDMCSAPGGKSFTAYQSSNGKCEITACDIHSNRVELIKQNAKRLELKGILALCMDATVFDENLGKFDAVMCDVPCTGFGVLSRKPEIKYKDLSEYKDITEIQYSILENAVNYLKKDGRILYSTCTLRKCENDGIISRFINNHNDFEIDYMHTFFPHTDNTDGFFAAVLKNKG